MKILLAGDSWGCGVWQRIPLRVIHKGIEQFMLDDGHEVVNVSTGGGKNGGAINRMLNIKDNFDYIFVFETSPLRDAGCFDEEISLTKWFHDYEDLINIISNKRFEYYTRLNSLNKTIYLLGGCSKVDMNMVKDFSNIKVVIPSIPEFLSPGYVAPEIYVDGWVKDIDNKYDLETIDKIIEQKQLWWWLNRNCSHFKDDFAHPDRHGYEKVYNYIKETVFKL